MAPEENPDDETVIFLQEKVVRTLEICKEVQGCTYEYKSLSNVNDNNVSVNDTIVLYSVL